MNPFAAAATPGTGSKASGTATPQFLSQSEQEGVQKGPTSSASSYLLELQHSQITEVGSEYEVTQNDQGRPSIGPGSIRPAQSEGGFSFGRSQDKGGNEQEELEEEEQVWSGEPGSYGDQQDFKM